MIDIIFIGVTLWLSLLIVLYIGLYRLLEKNEFVDGIKFLIISLIIVSITAPVADHYAQLFINYLPNYFLLCLIVAGIIISISGICKYWGEVIEPERAKIYAQVLSIGVAAILGFSVLRTNRDETKCIRNLEQKNEIIGLVNTVSNSALEDIGTPLVCYDTKGGTQDINFPNDRIHDAWDNYKKEKQKLSVMMHNMSVNYYPGDNWTNYSNALKNLEEKCSGKDNEYHDHTYRDVGKFQKLLINDLDSWFSNTGCNKIL